jgi:hypothetical protein
MPTRAPTKPSAASVRMRTARAGRPHTSFAFATPHTHGRSSFISARQSISLTFREGWDDAGQGRNSIVSSASRRGRTAPSSAITRLVLSLNRSLSATIVSGVSLRSRGSGGQPHNLTRQDHARVAARLAGPLGDTNRSCCAASSSIRQHRAAGRTGCNHTVRSASGTRCGCPPRRDGGGPSWKPCAQRRRGPSFGRILKMASSSSLSIACEME